MSTPALETHGLFKSFGALRVSNNIDFRLEPGARHALIGPERRRQIDLRQSGDRRADAQRGTDPVRRRGHHRAQPGRARQARRWSARSRSITLFRGLSVLENVTLAVTERQRRRGQPVPPVGLAAAR